MKKIRKTPGPNALTSYAEAHPNDTWEKFRDARTEYEETKKQVFRDQGDLCAYCETRLKEAGPANQRLEHIHPKSDIADGSKNWALDWENIIGVCHGGSATNDGHLERPSNLSCDAYKDHFMNRQKLPPDCGGWLINPLHLPHLPCLFQFDLNNGELKPDREQCDKLQLDANKNTFDLVNKTIEMLNLNCDRLKAQRMEVLFDLNREKKKARERSESSVDFKRKLVARYLQTRWPSFFTTRRILLGNAFEAHFQEMDC